MTLKIKKAKSKRMVTLPRSLSIAEEYAQRVVDGRIVAGNYVRYACERYAVDMKESESAKGRWYFDRTAAEKIVDFFPTFLVHFKGKWGKDGTPFNLEPWQQFIWWNVFGFRWREDDARRINFLWVEIARKNAKSTQGAGIGIYMTGFDDEPGAEVYAAATKKDQAKIIFDTAAAFIAVSPDLQEVFDQPVLTWAITQSASFSSFKPISADAKKADGFNSHCNLIDEVHEHGSQALWDKLLTGEGAREQSLTCGFTTAGADINSMCWDEHDLGVRVLENRAHRPEAFYFIASLDPKDSWQDESVHVKANPNMDVPGNWLLHGGSVIVRKFKQEFETAKVSIAKQNGFKHLRLNMWTTSESAWIDVIKYWDPLAIDPALCTLEALRGKTCYVAVDMAERYDFASVMALFPFAYQGKRHIVVPKYYLPEDTVQEHIEKRNVKYREYIDGGWLTTIPGSSTDPTVLEDYIVNEIGSRCQIAEVPYDPWNALGFATMLEEKHKIPTVRMRQGHFTMSEPMKDTEKDIRDGMFAHPGCQVTRWCLQNVMQASDPAGNVKPARNKRSEKMDGGVTLIMANGRARLNVPQKKGKIHYEAGSLQVLGGIKQ